LWGKYRITRAFWLIFLYNHSVMKIDLMAAGAALGAWQPPHALLAPGSKSDRHTIFARHKTL
jgi:hypothetical protein